MKEKNNNEIQIDDIEPAVITEFLELIYTGKSSNLDKFAMRLFIAADKYQINSLKEICEEALISSLEIDNWVSLLLMGDKCSTAIKKSAITFMINNKSSINLDEVLLDHPSLMLEILKEDFGKWTKHDATKTYYESVDENFLFICLLLAAIYWCKLFLSYLLVTFWFQKKWI